MKNNLAKVRLFIIAIQLIFVTNASGLEIPFSLNQINEQLNDPTKPPDFVMQAQPREVKTGPLAVSAIYIYPSYRLAIINNTPMMLGNQIGSFTITAITPYTVELSDRSNNKMILELIRPIKTRRE